MLAERQKLIKIANRSDNGWGVVAEYTVDELADDSGNEKHLEKMKNAAERKAGLEKQKRVQAATKQPSRAPHFPNVLVWATLTHQFQLLQQPGPIVLVWLGDALVPLERSTRVSHAGRWGT